MTDQTQLATGLSPIAPLKSKPELIWLGFSADTDFDAAARIFERRHGKPPRAEVRTPGALLVGPIEGES